MICNDVAEYISALCDGKTIPPPAAQHIGTCLDCQARLSDYLAMGVELRRAASLGLAEAVASRVWTKPQNRVATWWQKGWGTMRIPRLAFAGLIAGILVLASALAVNRARAQNTGTVVLLTTVGPNGPLAECALSTQDRTQGYCVWYGKVGSRFLAYNVYLVTRVGGRVRLMISAMTYAPGANPGSPESQVGSNKLIWFEPGEPLKFDVPQVGTLTLEGEWMDHMPILGTLEPIPNEIRLGTPLLLKDNLVVGDLSSWINGILSLDLLDAAFGFEVSGQGRFLLSQVPMKGAVVAHVAQGRITFDEGGHSWELLSGVPVCRADHIWVLHQPDFKAKAIGPNGTTCCSNLKLVQTEPGLWEPQEKPK
jgi:hypothetical protein